MYSIAASRGPPAFVRRKNESKERPPDFVSDSFCEENNNQRGFIATPFLHHTRVASPGLDESNRDDKSKAEKFWKRKGVVKLDPADGDRCSHTSVPPSTMMALAMELHVSNRGKASRMFRNGKLRSQDSVEEDEISNNKYEESKLVNTWVVPEPSVSSRESTPNTAAHLQPSLVNADFVLNRPPTPSTLPHAPSPLTSESFIEPKLDKHEIEFFENLTVEDLVGSADHVVPYYDSQSESGNDEQDEVNLNRSEKESGKNNIKKSLDANNNYTNILRQDKLQENGDKKLNKSNAGLSLRTFARHSGDEQKPLYKRSVVMGKENVADHLQKSSKGDSDLSTRNESLGFDGTVEFDKLVGCKCSFNASQDNLNHTNMSPEFTGSLKSQQMSDCNALKLAFNETNDRYKMKECVTNELLQAYSSSREHKLLIKDNAVANEKLLKDAPQLQISCEDKLSGRSIESESNTDSGSCRINKEVNITAEKNSKDLALVSQKKTGDEDTPEQLRASPKKQVCSNTEATTQDLAVNSRPKFSESSSSCSSHSDRSEASGFCGGDLAASKSMSSSLVSLSSLDSMSSASYHLSSCELGKGNAASCRSCTSDLQQSSIDPQGTFLITESAFNERGRRNHLKDGLANPSGSRNVTMSNTDVTSQCSSLIYRNCSSSLGKTATLPPRPRSENSSVSHERSISSSSKSSRPESYLRGDRRGSFSALELRRPRSASPSRKVICEYISHDTPIESKSDRKSPSGLVISQAVFADERDCTVATPVLYLKNKNRICIKCKNKMLLCCCGSNRSKAFANNNCQNTKVPNFGDYSKIDNHVVVSSLSNQLQKVDKSPNTRKIQKRGRTSKPPNATTSSSNRNKTQSDKLSLAKSSSTSAFLIQTRPSSVEASINTEPAAKVTTSQNKEGCRVTVTPLQHSPKNRNTSFSYKSVPENKQVSNDAITSKQLGSSAMDQAKLHDLLLTAGKIQTLSSRKMVAEDVAISKKCMEESFSFNDGRSQNKAKKKFEVVNKNPRVRVTNGSHITLKKPFNECDKVTAKCHSKSMNSFDKKAEPYELITEDKVSPSMATPSQTGLSSGQSRRREIKTTSTGLDSLKRDSQCRYPIDKNTHLTGNMQRSNEPVKQLEASSMHTSTTVRMIKPDTSKQNGSRAAVSQNFVGKSSLKHQICKTGHIEKKMENKQSQKRYGVVLENFVSEPQFRKVEIRTPSPSKEKPPFVNERPNSRCSISRNAPCASDSSSTNTSRTNSTSTSIVMKESPNKPSYSSSISVALQPYRRKSQDTPVTSPSNSFATASPAQHEQTAKVEKAPGFQKRSQYRQWAQEWAAASGIQAAESKAAVKRHEENNERRDAKTSSPHLSPEKKHSTNAARPPIGSPVRQVYVNRVLFEGHSSPNAENVVQLNKGYEKDVTHSDEGSRTVSCYQARNVEGTQGCKQNGDVDCIRETPPPHTIEDEEDFSGVVEGPLLRVKDIRAKYKVRDYENYAKPRSASSSSNNTSRKGSGDGSRRSFYENELQTEGSHEMKNEVAQQVMNLFKGALDVEKELAVFEEESRRMESEQRNQLSPSKRNGHVTMVIETTRQDNPARESLPYNSPRQGRPSNGGWSVSTEEEGKTEKKENIKAAVEHIKAESNGAASFDESLDQFYDVLNDLTS